MYPFSLNVCVYFPLFTISVPQTPAGDPFVPQSVGGPFPIPYGANQQGPNIQSAVNVPEAGFPPIDGANIPFNELPQWLQNLEGRTVSGSLLMGGIGGLPQHGGLGNDGDYSSGLREGWGADRTASMPQSLSSWVAPQNLDSSFLQRISSEFFQGSPGRIDQAAQGHGNGASRSGIEIPRVDSFTAGSIGNIDPFTSTGHMERILSQSGAQRSNNQGFNPAMGGVGAQLIGTGIPAGRAGGFMHVFPENMVSSSLPGQLTLTGSLAGRASPSTARRVNIYGRRP